MIPQKRVRDKFALHRIPHHHGDDVAGVFDVRQADGIKLGTYLGHTCLVRGALSVASLKVPDRGRSTRRHCGRQSGRKDKPTCERAYKITQLSRGRDVAANNPKRLERS